MGYEFRETHNLRLKEEDKMKTNRLVCFGMAIAIMVLLAGAFAERTPEAAQPEPEKKPLVIGHIVDLSKIDPRMGRYCRDAALLRVEEVNAAGGIGGRKVEYVVLNDEGDPSRTVALAQGLVARGARGILMGYNSACMAALADLAKENKIPIIGPVVATDSLADHPFMFLVSGANLAFIKDSLHRIQQRGFKKVALMYATTTWGIDFSKQIRVLAPEYGIEVVGMEGATEPPADLTVQARSLRNGNPNIVMLSNYTAGHAAWFRAINAIGWKVHTQAICGPLGSGIGKVIDPRLAEGAEVVSHIDPRKPESKAIYDAFNKRFGDADGLQMTMYCGYEAARLLLEGARRATNPDSGASIKEGLESIRDFPIGIGTKALRASFSATDHITLEPGFMVPWRVVNGVLGVLDY
jgi:branched-chain amino acid transport system substrate-binding protein